MRRFHNSMKVLSSITLQSVITGLPHTTEDAIENLEPKFLEVHFDDEFLHLFIV